MQEEDIKFEEVGKDDTSHAEQPSALFRKPIRGAYGTLYNELKARCAPENFMSPYEPDKVSRANELYSQVLSTNMNDDTALKALRLKAMEELGVIFSTQQLYTKLTNACNPRNYTGANYNKKQLELANQLSQLVQMNADNVIALEKLEVQASELLKEYDKRKKDDVRQTEENDGFVLFVSILIIFFFLFIVLVLSKGS